MYRETVGRRAVCGAEVDRLVQQWMSDAKYAPLSDSSSDSDSDSDSDSGESMDGRGQSTTRSKMELTEVFTWMTLWVMIIFAVYS
eukprot:COSAG02_NODE_24799_length_677_cov_1.147059_1_plen_84_part_10